jgi:PLP dependent protein
MNTISDRLSAILNNIRDYEQDFSRTKGSVTLLAVSKKQTIASVRQAYESGQRIFGENYLQEALPKIQSLEGKNISWHFIGRIQSNKTKAVAENFDWVHTLDRKKIAFRLNEHRAKIKRTLNVLIQVNISGEESKSGVCLDVLPDLIDDINSLPWLTLRGVMGMPARHSDFTQQCLSFKPLMEAIKLQRQEFDTLSLGTSQDFKAAIAVGSTMVRIGEAIFGSRKERSAF